MYREKNVVVTVEKEIGQGQNSNVYTSEVFNVPQNRQRRQSKCYTKVVYAKLRFVIIINYH